MTRNRMILIAVAAVVLAFLAGFGWQYARAEGLEARVAAAERDLVFATAESTLAAAAIAAQQGQYDVALQQASAFFTTLQQYVALAPPAARDELDAVLAQRDATIATISRQDPAAANALGRLFLRYRTAIGGPDKALPIAVTPPENRG